VTRATVRQTRLESRARIVQAVEELVRVRSFPELSVDEVMREAGFGRTIFYRHFDDLGDLVMRASREAVEELFDAQRAFVEADQDDPTAAVRHALEAAVQVYGKHGPLLRCVGEAAAVDERIAEGHHAMLRRFDEFAEQSLRELGGLDRPGLGETVRALNLMNVAYLTDVFGREPRVDPDTAVHTLTGIWAAVIDR